MEKLLNRFLQLADKGLATIVYGGDVADIVSEIKKNVEYEAFESKFGELIIYKKEVSEGAKKVLNDIKNNDKVYLAKKDDVMLKNTNTQNFVTIFGDGYKGEHYFGVYGDVFGKQIDSRDYPSGYIAKIIDMILEQGYELV